MSSTFEDLGIAPSLLKGLYDMGFEAPTEVQTMAIPHILNGEDLIVMAKTGTGKTAVFGVPILQLTDPEAPGPLALILAPTRELAVQVDSDLKLMAKHVRHRTTAVYGQHSMNTEIQALSKGATIVTGTPGRVFDHICQRNLKTQHIRFLVLDEADRMLDMGFMDQVRRIIKTIPKNRTTLVFSATIPPDIRKICRDNMKNPETIEIESRTMTVDSIQQKYYRVRENEKNAMLHRVLMMERPDSCMIFCNMRVTVDRVQNFLVKQGYDSRALHGDIPQEKRLKTLQQFKDGKFSLLVATDVAGRGIHIDDLSLVINYDVPNELDNYVHRIGRTGRAGSGGRSVTLVTGEDIMSLYEIEEHIGCLIEEAEFPPEAYLNENRAAIDKWMQDHARKITPAPPPPKSKPKDGQQKRSRSQSRQSNKRSNDRLPTAAPGAETPQLTVVPPSQPNIITKNTHNAVPITAKDRQSPAPAAEETTTFQENTGKVSFLQRLLDSIKGKKKK